MRSTKFFQTDAIRVSAKMNDYMKSNFGYSVKGDLKSLTEAKAKLVEMKSKMDPNKQDRVYVEAMVMLETINAMLKAHKQGPSSIVKTKVSEKVKNSNKSLSEQLMSELNELMENDTATAEVTMAARGIVDELQDVIEKLGKIQNDQLGPLADEMNYSHGGDQASTFRTTVDDAIGSLMDQARQSKDAVGNAVLVLTGEQPAGDMSPELGGDMTDDFEDDVSMDMGDDLPEFGDEPDLSADPAASGPVDEPLGRARR